MASTGAGAGADGSGEVLFFIPDIGGFTRFVAETEIRHSQHIVKELLEILVDANTLVTPSTLARLPAADEQLVAFRGGSCAYDGLGDIAYRYRPLGDYLGEVVVEPPSRFSLKHPVQVMTLDQPVAAPVESVYQRLIDLPARMQWIDGIRSIEFRDDSANHLGKVHRCVRDGNDPERVTSDVKMGPQSMELWETDVKRMASCRYLLTRLPGDATRVTVEFFVRGNLLRLAFKAFVERRFKASFERSLRNFAALCEGRAG